MSDLIPCEVRLTRIDTSATKTLISDPKSCKVKFAKINTSASRTLVSDLIPCEVRLTRINTSGSQQLDQSSNYKRKSMIRKRSRVSHIMPARGARKSSKSSISLRSSQHSEKFGTPQKQTHLKRRKKCERRSLPNQAFPITSTPINGKATLRYETSKENNNVGKMTSLSSQTTSVKSPNKTAQSSSRYSLRSRSNPKLITEKVKPRKQTKMLQNVTPIVKKTIINQVSSTSYQKKPSKDNQKSSNSDSKTSSSSSRKTSNTSSTKSQKHLHTKRKNVSDIPITDLTLPGMPLQPRKVKSDNFKLPGKNTLKRKRYEMEVLKKLDENYEDDLYQSQKFENFKDLLLCSPESNASIIMSTPKLAFQATPLIRHNTPKFKDIYSPTLYAKSRKLAEKCMYGKKKNKIVPTEIPVEPEKKKLEFSAIISEACKIQQSIESMTEGSEQENSYFSFTD